jgi:hypothetical protein
MVRDELSVLSAFLAVELGRQGVTVSHATVPEVAAGASRLWSSSI